MKKKKNKRSQLAQSVERYQTAIETGRFISIDPSSGSSKSLPGYAIFNRGKLVDAGLIRIPPGTRDVNHRLYDLREVMKGYFREPDILVLEMINFSAGGKSSGALQKAIGAMMTLWPVPVLEVAPSTWKKYLHLAPGYTKSDVNDAIMIGQAVIWTLQEQQGLTLTPLPKPNFSKGS